MPYPEPLPIDVSKQQQVKNATAQKEMLLNWLSGQKSADVQGQFHCHLINWKLNYANITEIPRLEWKAPTKPKPIDIIGGAKYLVCIVCYKEGGDCSM